MCIYQSFDFKNPVDKSVTESGCNKICNKLATLMFSEGKLDKMGLKSFI